MKKLLLTMVAIAVYTLTAQAQTPTVAPKTDAPALKITARDIRALPFANEHRDVKFKANSREIPDELTVTRGDKIRIYGKKRSDGAPSVRGVPTGHVGQVVLLPAGDRQGTLTLKKEFGSSLYFAVMELAGDTLDSKHIKLKEGMTYKWSVSSGGGRTTLRVIGEDGTEAGSNTAPTDKLLGFGFAATVRHKGNEVDLTISYE